ncbi:hypothetical protein M3Y97_00079700 [Aphelenchoides bicaudatus]|nr:hypothetical protein M3Y97_00079700 [Aphelenchoides bicaudatus]
MPAKKSKAAAASKSTKRGRPKKQIKKAPAKASSKKAKPTNDTHSEVSNDNNASDDVSAQNGNAVLANNSENTDSTKNETEMIAELQEELRKAEQSKRVLYNALIRERSLNNDKPSIASSTSKTGHNFAKPYSALSGDQKKDRIRLLASVVGEFADPKNNSPNKTMEVKFVMESLKARWDSTPKDFE